MYAAHLLDRMKAAYTNPTATPSGRSGLEAALGVCRAAGLVAVGAASLPQPLPAPVLGQLPGCMTIKRNQCLSRLIPLT